MPTITADVDYVQGILRYGWYELNLSEEDYEKFKKLSKEEQMQKIEDDAKFIVGDYDVDSIGDITDIYLPEETNDRN